MICPKHNKDITANCTWCGKGMCRLCISRTDGKKIYCRTCVDQIGDFIKDKQLRVIKEEAKKEVPERTQYFNFSKLKMREQP